MVKKYCHVQDLDFCLLCEAFDFFVITLEHFNKCTLDYKNGIVPVDKPTGNTLVSNY